MASALAEARPGQTRVSERRRGTVERSKRKNGWQACWREGGKQCSGPYLFQSKTEAKRWLDENLRGGRLQHSADDGAMVATPAPRRDITFAEHVERYLRVHAAMADPSTIKTLSDRLGATPLERRKRRPYRTPLEAFGHVTLAELEPMSVEIAEWQATLPTGLPSCAHSARC